MKKLFLTSIIITACVALYAAVWPQITGDGKVPVGPAKPSVSAEIETKPEETPSIFFLLIISLLNRRLSQKVNFRKLI